MNALIRPGLLATGVDGGDARFAADFGCFSDLKTPWCGRLHRLLGDWLLVVGRLLVIGLRVSRLLKIWLLRHRLGRRRPGGRGVDSHGGWRHWCRNGGDPAALGTLDGAARQLVSHAQQRGAAGAIEFNLITGGRGRIGTHESLNAKGCVFEIGLS